MNTQLFIPKKIKVGYQNRNDTYTKKLAYVIYYDNKGKLRKEASWSGWRDDKIEASDYDNVPTEGFVLNKGVGGTRESHGWNARNEYIRVFDPRGFEFEISVANLLFILTESSSFKGKGLEGEFVYSWDGKDLVLIPVSCQNYKDSNVYTELQSEKVSAKTLIPGATYLTKKQVKLIYLGKFDWYTYKEVEDLASPVERDHTNMYYSNSRTKEYNRKTELNGKPDKKFVFETVDKSAYGSNYVTLSDMTTLATLISDVPIDDYAERMDRFIKCTQELSPVVGIEILQPNRVHYKVNDYGGGELLGSLGMIIDGKAILFSASIEREYDRTLGKYTKDNKCSIYSRCEFSIEDGKFVRRSSRYTHKYKENLTVEQALEKPWKKIVLLLENGIKIDAKDFSVTY